MATVKICKEPDCEKRVQSCGWCPMHYARFRKHGDARYVAPKSTVCMASGCDRPPRSYRAQWCEMHYGRMRRSGTLDAKPVRRYLNDVCSVDSCDSPTRELGMCSKHARRVRRHGDPLAFTPPSERKVRRGSANRAWSGDHPTYAGAHNRVRAARGPATSHHCVDCGAQARHWSYDHSDADALVTERGYPYSADPDHYVPRCVSCHKIADLNKLTTQIAS